MIKLRLNGVNFDMTGNDDFALSFSASKLQSIESRSGDFSTTFSLPLTSSLATAIGHTNRLDSASQFPYSDIAAEVFINEILVFNGFAKVLRITDVLEMQVFSGNSNWLNLINEKQLQELDLSALNLTMNAANVQANRLNDYTVGFLFPNAYYGAFALPAFKIIDCGSLFKSNTVTFEIELNNVGKSKIASVPIISVTVVVYSIELAVKFTT